MLNFREFKGSYRDLVAAIGVEKTSEIDCDYIPITSKYKLQRNDTVIEHVVMLGFEYNDEYFIPEYQRDLVWTLEQKQSLIESILNGNPIGDFVVNLIRISKDDDRRIRVVDGQQRINALREFCSLDFPLKNGKFANQLKYWDLRHFFEFRVIVHQGLDLSIQDEINIYLGRNCGGSMHTADDIEKAKKFIPH